MVSIVFKRARLGTPTLAMNSFWGLSAQLAQSILLSLFFVLLARIYSPEHFSKFIIASVFYQLFAAFSTMGLNQWYIRQLVHEQGAGQTTIRFFAVQSRFGALFYIISIVFAFALYSDGVVRILYLLLGLNIFFDNLINAIKSVNIAGQEQRKTFVITVTDALGKLLIAAVALWMPVSIEWLAALLILFRVLSIGFYLGYGTGHEVSFAGMLGSRVSTGVLKSIVAENWAFVVIGALSIINWRFGTILISKVLSPVDLANYEIGYRIFAIAQMVVVAVIGSVFPMLAKYWLNKEMEDFRTLFAKLHLAALLYGCLAFSFVYCFIDTLIPALFHSTYNGAVAATRFMFFTILVFPSAFLQANVLVAARKERVDMVLNLLNLVINSCGALVAVFVLKSVHAVILSIFIAFVVFHLVQEVILVRMKLSSARRVLGFYSLLLFTIGYHYLASDRFAHGLVFAGFVMVILLLYVVFGRKFSGGLLSVNS